MKLLVTADWHIKLKAKNIPTDTAEFRFRHLFNQLLDTEHGFDAHVIAGDIFDKLPTPEEFDLFCEYLERVTIPTYIIPGNHESTTKFGTFFQSYIRAFEAINSLVTVITKSCTIFDGRVDVIPYNELKRFNPDDFSASVLVTHVRGAIPPHVQPEVDLDLFNRWKVVLAGDLHSYENSQRNILYPGSPMTTSFHRSLTETGAISFDLDTLEHSRIILNVPQLIKKTVQAGMPTPPTDFHYTIYEVEGNLAELAQVEAGEGVIKKAQKRDSDTALILTPEMTVRDELEEFLRYILQLQDSQVEETLNVYTKYSDNLHTT